MTHHPHVHMIVPGGGISADGCTWISSSEDFLLPVPVLKRLFRAKMLALLKAAHAAGKSAVLQRARASCRRGRLQGVPRPALPRQVARLRQAPVRRT